MKKSILNLGNLKNSNLHRFPFYVFIESVLFALLDFFSILICLIVVLGGSGTEYTIGSKIISAHSMSLLTAVCWSGYAWQSGLYGTRRPFWDDLFLLIKGLLFIAFLSVGVFVLAVGSSSTHLLSAWIFIVVAVPCVRTLVKLLLIKAGLWQIPVVVIGSGVNASQTVLALRDERLMGYCPVAMVNVEKARSDSADAKIDTRTSSFTFPVLRDLSTAKNLIKDYPQIKIALAVDTLLSEENLILLKHLTSRYKDLLVVPAIRGLPLYSTDLLHCFSHETLLLRVRNNLSNARAQFVKRAFDVIVSGLALLVLGPFFVIISLLIRRDGGKAFFSHTRVGREGELFGCMKFRSMISNSQEVLKNLLESDAEARAEWARDQKLRNDPRITSVGHFLRKTSLDELPQLINVLKGDMSLVGPRPVTQEELVRYGEEVSFYLRVKPGITGLWQVSGRNDTSYETRVALDMWYVQNWSVYNDFVILFKTIKVVLGRDGSY